MTLPIILITTVYVILITTFIVGFFRLKTFHSNNKINTVGFSVIIPFRNEEMNLQALLDSISILNYPKKLFEILLINDASEDNFESIISSFKKNNPSIRLEVFQNVRISNSPKKDAINTGIKNSSFDWILTTDADCIIPKNWIHTYNNFIIERDPIFVAGPVTFMDSKKWIHKFQLIDFSALVGSTIGSFGIRKPIMCNGANMCYKKEIFKKIKGFEGNDNIASGDDVFLLEKMIKYDAKKVHFLKSYEILIQTKPLSTFKELIEQRIRWASKTTAYTNTFSKIVGVIVLMMNLLFTFLLIKNMIHLEIELSLILIFTLKIIVDLSIIIPTLKFVKKQIDIPSYLITILLHPAFISYIAVNSIFKTKYRWKNRLL